jgi:anti-sigma factor ChrR (cupin superfamily)
MNFEELDSLLGGESEQEKRDFRELAAALALAQPLQRPPAELKSRLLSRIQSQAEELLPGVFVRRGGDGGWKPTRFEGVSYKTLYLDRAEDTHTLLLRFAPGARYPRHRHAKVEQCLVLSGEVTIDGKVTMGPGDFEWAAAQTTHDEIFSANGSEVLIIASLHDEVLA